MQLKYKHNKELTKFSRINRKNQTDAEKFLWYHLRNNQLAGLKFRRQYPIGTYILDFYCPEKNLAVELDGSQHTENTDYDQRRADFLKKNYIEILRFWDNEVLKNIDGVKLRILERVSQI